MYTKSPNLIGDWGSRGSALRANPLLGYYSSREALKRVEQSELDLAIVDLDFAGGDGIALMKALTVSWELRRGKGLWVLGPVESLRGGVRVEELEGAGRVGGGCAQGLPIRRLQVRNKLDLVGATENVLAGDGV